MPSVSAAGAVIERWRSRRRVANLQTMPLSCRRCSPPWGNAALLCCLFALAATACGPGGESADAKPDGAAAGDGDPACHGLARRWDGTCCHPGTWYAHERGACVPVGPVSCEAQIPSEPAGCVPKWCWTGLDSAGVACGPWDADCLPVGRACTGQDLASEVACEAGTWRPSATSPCVPAGTSADVAAVLAAGAGDLPPPVTPSDVPWDGPLPPPEDTRFCGTAEQPRPCRPDEVGCGARAMPDPDVAGGCVPVGVPWACPPGFLPAAGGAAAGSCEPDPADCGAAPWGDAPVEAGAVFVDAAAGAGGDGSQGAPLRELAAAVAKVGPGGTIVMAAGTYAAPGPIGAPLTLRGRCAALVKIDGSGGFAAVEVVSKKAPAFELVLRDLTLSGACRGLHAQGPVSVQARRIHVAGARGIGVRAWLAGAHVELREAVVSATVAGPKFQGLGVLVDEGATATLGDVAVLGNADLAILVRNPGSAIEARAARIDGFTTGPGAGGPSGVHATDGGRLDLKSVSVRRVRGNGVLVLHGGTKARIAGAVVHDLATVSGADPGGAGLVVGGGAAVELAGVRIRANATQALGLRDPGTAVTARGLIVDSTPPPAPSASCCGGVWAASGASLELWDARLSHHAGFGLLVNSSGTRVRGGRVLVDRVEASADGAFWGGIHAQPADDPAGGPDVRLRLVRLRAVEGAGVQVYGPGTRVVLEELLVDGGLPVSGGHKMPGFGISAQLGAHVSLRGARLHGSRGAGLTLFDAGTVVDAWGLLVDGTLPTVSGAYGLGAQVLQGRLVLAGSRLVANHTAGLVAAGQGAMLRAHGLRVEGTLPVLPADARRKETGSLFGAGVVVADKVTDVTIASSLIVRNHMAGLYVLGAAATIRDCVIGQTHISAASGPPGESGLAGVWSDGVILKDAWGSVLERCVLLGNARTGALVTSTREAHVRANVATGNTYGLALLGLEDADVSNNLLYDNTTNLSTDAALSVPPPPQTASW